MSTILAILLVSLGIFVSGAGGWLLHGLYVDARADAARGRRELIEARSPQGRREMPKHRAADRPERTRAGQPAQTPERGVSPDVQAPPPVYQPPYQATGTATVSMDFGDQLVANNAVLRALARNEPLPAAANDEPTTLLPPVVSESGGVR